ncbi:MAG: pyridoxal phosphate-dependent aminotransferase [Pseudomonadota bacterium]
MFSNRSNWNLSPNFLEVILEQKRAKGEHILDLTGSNPTTAGFSYPVDLILSALAQSEAMFYEPHPKGLFGARQAIAGYYKELGKTVDPDSIFITASTSEAYSLVFKLLADTGDEILIPQPGYPLLSYLGGLESLTCIYYPLRYDQEYGWKIDIDTLRAVISPRTKAIVLVSPNNPTGSYIKEHELEALLRIAYEHGLALIIDEVFSDFFSRDDPDRVRTAVNAAPDTLFFVLNGLSKLVGLPQLKLGWIVVNNDAQFGREASARLEMINDFYLSASSPAQIAVESLLAMREDIQRQVRCRLSVNYSFLEKRFSKTTNVRVLKREGGWYAILEFFDDISDDDRALSMLELDNVFAHPGYFYEFSQEGFMVFSLLTPHEEFKLGVDKIASRFSKG